jgi:hypothetical protein
VQYLVQMRIVPEGRPMSPEAGVVLLKTSLIRRLNCARSCRMRRRSWPADR